MNETMNEPGFGIAQENGTVKLHDKPLQYEISKGGYYECREIGQTRAVTGEMGQLFVVNCAKCKMLLGAAGSIGVMDAFDGLPPHACRTPLINEKAIRELADPSHGPSSEPILRAAVEYIRQLVTMDFTTKRGERRLRKAVQGLRFLRQVFGDEGAEMAEIERRRGYGSNTGALLMPGASGVIDLASNLAPYESDTPGGLDDLDRNQAPYERETYNARLWRELIAAIPAMKQAFVAQGEGHAKAAELRAVEVKADLLRQIGEARAAGDAAHEAELRATLARLKAGDSPEAAAPVSEPAPPSGTIEAAPPLPNPLF